MSKRVEKNKKISKKIEREEKREILNSHLKSILKIILIFLILGFILFYYMRFIETKMLFVKEVKIESASIPESLSGLKIVHFSDLHYLMSTEEKDLEHLVKKVNQLKADIVVFTGDLLDENIKYSNKELEVLKDKLSKMKATIAKYYVKGNHDYYINSVEEIFEGANFISLNNTNDIVYGKNHEQIYINGMGSFIQNDFEIASAFEGLENRDVFTISLFHEPDNILELKDKKIDLALAGHSHNRQIKIPYFSSLFRVDGAKSYYENHYTVNNTELYINAGIGTSIYKLRLMAPPTVNLYRIVKSN